MKLLVEKIVDNLDILSNNVSEPPTWSASGSSELSLCSWSFDLNLINVAYTTEAGLSGSHVSAKI